MQTILYSTVGYREFARATYKGQPKILVRRAGGRPL
jgi:hypothetical protein